MRRLKATGSVPTLMPSADTFGQLTLISSMSAGESSSLNDFRVVVVGSPATLAMTVALDGEFRQIVPQNGPRPGFTYRRR